MASRRTHGHVCGRQGWLSKPSFTLSPSSFAVSCVAEKLSVFSVSPSLKTTLVGHAVIGGGCAALVGLG